MTSEEIYQYLSHKIFIAHRIYSNKNEDILVFAESPAEARSKAKEYFEKTSAAQGISINYVSVYPAKETDIPYIFKLGIGSTD